MEYVVKAQWTRIHAGTSVVSQSIQAVEVAMLIYQGNFNSISAATTAYAQLGRALAEVIFNALHPNVLGKMIYTPSDF